MYYEEIWIEAEQWSNEYDIYDENTDVKVIFENGTEAVATFITNKNIMSLREKNQATGECLSGNYF
ncbi:hypothetical protein [Bacillus sp. AFS088145]|uniref:hypothetical protein n=1 Tax=Bacillus sp. AFS088145 TaxID=2033514 RepID=UPI000BF64263|nr:hypothetical protein [Bacillus sp. AFS088145]PFH83840.1 hypothetical protein COI44_17190 [Bacillus sp. AFS088145]